MFNNVDVHSCLHENVDNDCIKTLWHHGVSCLVYDVTYGQITSILLSTFVPRYLGSFACCFRSTATEEEPGKKCSSSWGQTPRITWGLIDRPSAQDCRFLILSAIRLWVSGIIGGGLLVLSEVGFWYYRRWVSCVVEGWFLVLSDIRLWVSDIIGYLADVMSGSTIKKNYKMRTKRKIYIYKSKNYLDKG